MSMCSLGHSESPRLWLLSAAPLSWLPFPAQEGPGLSAVALGVSGMHCAQVRCWASPGRLLASLQEEVRLRCSSRLGAVAGLWLPAPLGEETRLGPSSPTADAGPARLGC